MKKHKKVKGWAVVCNKPEEVSNSVFAFVKKNTATEKKKWLDKEFSGFCRHKVVPCEIIITPTPNPKEVNEMKTWKRLSTNSADRLWSKLVRARDGKCLYCGKREYLQAHHLFGRSKSATRYVLDNGFSLCGGCHTFSPIFSAHRTEQSFKKWAQRYLGKKRYTVLERLSNKVVSRERATKEFEESLRDLEPIIRA